MDLRTTLEDLCLNIRNERSSLIPSPVVPNRAQFIMNKLTEMEIAYTLDSYLPHAYYNQPIRSDERGDFKYYNIIVKFPAADTAVTDSIMFTAHHDINNPTSQNCQDNTASVVNILKLCSLLKEKNDLERNVYAVFTDCEEFGGKGAFRVCEQVHEGYYGRLKYIVNSELTAFGEYIWSERVPVASPLRRRLVEKLETLYEKDCPFNDSYIFRRMGGIDSICLGTLPKDEAGRLQTEFWHICHSDRDVVTQANYEHMEAYVQVLLSLV